MIEYQNDNRKKSELPKLGIIIIPLQLVFIALKLDGIGIMTTCPWILIFTPVLIPSTIATIVVLLVAFFRFGAWLLRREANRRFRR